MTQKLSKRELGARLLLLKEKQALLAKQINVLTQEINELAQPFASEPKAPPLITTSLIAKVLRESSGLMQCGEIAEAVLSLQGQPQFVDVGDNHYKAVKRILLRLEKQGLIERTGFHWRLKPLKLFHS
ncbi:hypothetical protein [Rodentibacter caecimuris]|uniref:Uncharacterized protein n=1 Tax=Rodentibacter caecimuris TaxID=1796644 RepID=A0A9X8YZ10_9PAST|nr:MULTISPECIES: hypothetical protein [Pasteurellaceae]AOF54306.1 hypothetical protein AC062_2220 [Pasteurellaceae bacterium NI1060]MCR1837836.1 hypothetical protein [Pasteurella caecimuris]MCU0106301.1 hypothetical protein [Pasteurella caecimuris]MCX2960157.1 hypothetical protein [Rodentibacter heylii]OOF71837.1 hypothetical protein BKG90_07200 [Rodentibacter heylii]